MTNKYIKRTQGFTLVELSIVIIIIGFLIAGIAAGQSLVKQAKLNAMINEITETNTAINRFKATYAYLPGDFPNATAYWPSESCYYGGPVSCNGNGNEFIDNDESGFVWDHLNQSKITLSAFYTYSIAPTVGKIVRYNQNTVAFIFVWGGWFYGNDLSYTNVLAYSYFDPGHIALAFTPGDAYNIDNKLDDGSPSSGRLMTQGPDSPGCTVEADGVTPISFANYQGNAKYFLSNNNLGCTDIIYILD